MALPKISDEQRKAALDRAAAVRKERAAVKGKIEKGEMSAADAFAKIDDPVVGKMRVVQFIAAFPGYGKAKTEKTIQELGIQARRRLQGLGARQREQLIARLDGEAA